MLVHNFGILRPVFLALMLNRDFRYFGLIVGRYPFVYSPFINVCLDEC
jgi:hypothetical protein